MDVLLRSGLMHIMFLGYQRICASFPHKLFCTSEGYKGTSIAHCHDEQDGYAELNSKEDKPGWQKAEPVERVYIKYEPKNKLLTHEATLPNHIEKEVKASASAVCVTN